jgi:hypothetical protein
VGIDLGVVAVSTVVNQSAQAVDSVVVDSVSPELEPFGIDMDAGVLTLNFSEIVRGNAIVITGITFHDKASASAQFTLTGGGLVLVDNALSLQVNMAVDDLNKIRGTVYIPLGGCIVNHRKPGAQLGIAKSISQRTSCLPTERLAQRPNRSPSLVYWIRRVPGASAEHNSRRNLV